MDLYGEKKNAWRTILFLSAIMLALFIADLFNPEVFFSETENRILAEKPEFSKEAVLNGKYMTGYENYVNDQFVGRNAWITMKTRMDILLQKKEINGVYLAKDDYLIEQHLPEEFKQEDIDKKLGLLQKLVGAYPQTKVMLVPTADNILTDKLPASAPYFDQRVFLQQVKNSIGEERVIDVFPTLENHVDEDIYYRTDHHWTSLGAFYGYQEFAKEYNLPARNYLLKEPVAITEDFQGTLQSKINLPVKSEKIYMYPQTLEKEYTVTYDMVEKTDSFYEESYLEGKNKYGYFLDDNHGLIEIERESYSEKVLFVIKDSYANSMIPLLAHHYEKVYVMDLRYFNGGLINFMKMCDTYGDMDVLVLYNCVHFINEFKFF